MILAFQYSGYDTANVPVRGVVYAATGISPIRG